MEKQSSRSTCTMDPSRWSTASHGLNHLDGRLTITSTAGVVYDHIYVMDKFSNTQGIVYYLIHVASQECPLESYTIRRRYNEFKEFHGALSLYMPTAPTSLFKRQNNTNPLIDEEKDIILTMSYATDNTIDVDSSVYLPPMPHGGLLAIMTPKENLVRTRIEYFNRILKASLEDPSPEVAIILRRFIREAPGARVNSNHFGDGSFISDGIEVPPSSPYVSLKDFSVPEISFSQERNARKRAVAFDRQRKCMS